MHGRSETPKNGISIEQIVDTVKKFCIRLKINNPSLCAYSTGALIAVKFAADNDGKELILMPPAGLKYYNTTSRIKNWNCKTIVFTIVESD